MYAICNHSNELLRLPREQKGERNQCIFSTSPHINPHIHTFPFVFRFVGHVYSQSTALLRRLQNCLCCLCGLKLFSLHVHQRLCVGTRNHEWGQGLNVRNDCDLQLSPNFDLKKLKICAKENRKRDLYLLCSATNGGPYRLQLKLSAWLRHVLITRA